MPNWLPIGPAPQINDDGIRVSGRVLCMAYSPDIGGGGAAVLIGCDGGGVWRTTDIGSDKPTWYALTDHVRAPASAKGGIMRVTALAAARQKPGLIFAATDAGVLRTDDGGLTWSLISSSHGFAAIACDPNDPRASTLYAAAGGVVKSTDGGATWSHAGTGLPTSHSATDLVLGINTDGSVALFAAVRDRHKDAPGTGIYQSNDGAATWTAPSFAPTDIATGLAAPLTAVGRMTLAIDPTVGFPGGVFAAISNAAANAMLDIVRLTPQGWRSARGSGPKALSPALYFQNASNQPITIAPSGTVYVGSATTGVVATADGGASWGSIISGATGDTPHVDGHALLVVGDDVYYGNDGGVFRFRPSAVGALTGAWASLNTTALQTHLLNGVNLHPTMPGIALVGSQDNGTARWTKGQWLYVAGEDSGLVRFDPDPKRGGKYAYTAGPPDPNPNFFWRSDHQGNAPWNDKGFFSNDAVPFFPPYVIHPVQTDRLLFGFLRLYESPDRGDTWKPISGNLVDGESASAFAYAGDDTTIYAAYDTSVFVTDATNQAGWRQIDGGTFTAKVTAMATDVQAPRTVYVGTETGEVWSTHDAGASWVAMSGGLLGFTVNTMVLHRRASAEVVLFIGTRVGVYAAVARGADTAWSRYGVGLPDTNVTDLQLHPTYPTLAAATFGRGAFIVGIDDAELPEVTVGLRADECGVSAVVGSQATLTTSVSGFGGSVRYAWSILSGAAIAAGPTDQPTFSISIPSTAPFSASVEVTDNDGNHAAATRTVTPQSAQEAALREFICQMRRYIVRNWLPDPLWDPLRGELPSRHEIEHALTVARRAVTMLEGTLHMHSDLTAMVKKEDGHGPS